MRFSFGTPGKSGGCPVGMAGAARVTLKSSRSQTLHCVGVKLCRTPHHRQPIGRDKDGAGIVRGPSTRPAYSPFDLRNTLSLMVQHGKRLKLKIGQTKQEQ